MKIVAFVPIKLQSQRLPNKMMLPLQNKLLFQHIFDTLLDVKKELTLMNIDLDIYCYCSDQNIKDKLPNEVIFLQRSVSLDSNNTKGMDIYKSFTDKIDSNIYMLCHATSPFITKESILKGLYKIIRENYDSAFSCSKIKTFCWYDNNPLNYSLIDVIKTQDIEPVYWETSAFYVFKKEIIKNKKRIGNNPYMVETNKIESIDIDELEDYELALNICK